MSVVITGGAGFVAVNLITRLLKQGSKVIALDNLCRGSISNIECFMRCDDFTFINVDLADLEKYRSVLKEISSSQEITHVWHLAANSDIPAGIKDINVDLKDTFTTTLNTLAIMEDFNIPNLLFASSSAVYGDHGSVELREDLGPLLPISNYGAMKLASEGLISAAAEKFLKSALIFRFPNVVGVPATHGVILDFMAKLKSHKEYLDVLGDGTQQKGYLHVEDLVEAMLFLQSTLKSKIDIFNIGPTDEGVTVRRIAEETIALFSPNAELRFGQGNKGWVGDVPKFRYSTEKTLSLGWKPSMGSLPAIKKAIKDIADQEQMS
jgi:UDP-glucose 4-epimerase